MMIQISLGLGTVLGRPAQAAISPAPGNMSITALAEFSRDRTIFDSAAQLGLAEARVPLSGTTDAPDGAVIEARAVSLDDGGATTTLWVGLTDAAGAPVTAAGGAFSGRITVPRSTSWFRAETRVQGSGAAPAQMANRFGVGHVWAYWEQSNGSRLISPGGAGFSPSSPIFDALAAPDGNVQIAYRGDTSRVFPVTTAERGNTPVTPTAVSMANAFHAYRPGEKLMMLWHTQQGTDIDDALTKTTEDATYATGGGRNFEVEQAIHAIGTIDGTQVGAVFIPGWIEAKWTVGANLPEFFLRRFIARDRAGTAVNPSSNNLPRYAGRIRSDGSDVAEAAGADPGLYDFRYTRFGWFGPHFYSVDMANLPSAASVTALSQLPGYDKPGDRTYNGMTKLARAIYKRANLPEVFDYPGVTHGAYQDETDTVHYTGSERDGRQRLGLMWMFYSLKMLGLIPDQIPNLDVRYDEPAGAYADFGIAGRNINTERLRRSDLAGGGSFTIDFANGTSVTVPRVIPPLPNLASSHRTEVMGWSIDKVPATNAVLMTASRHPVFPDGQKFCRVYNNGSAFDWKTCIEYGTGQMPGWQVDEDYHDRAYLNMLVANVGQPAAMLPGLPVQHQGTNRLPTTFAAPDLFAVVDAHFRNGSGTVVNAYNKAYMTILLRIDQMDVVTATVMGIVNNVYVRVLPDGGLQLTDGTNTAALPAGTIKEGVFCEYHFRVNRTAGSQGLAILNAGGTVLASASTVSGNFASGRVDFCDASSGSVPIKATVAKIATYLGQTSIVGSPTYAMIGATAAPYVTLVGTGLVQNRGTAPKDGVA